MKILHLAAIIAAAAASDFHGKSSAKFFFPAQTVAFRQFPAVCSWSPYPTFSPFEFYVPVARHQVELVLSAPAESAFWRAARVSIKKKFLTSGFNWIRSRTGYREWARVALEFFPRAE